MTSLPTRLQALPSTVWTANTQAWLRTLVIVFGTGFILYTSALITWRIIPEPEAPSTVTRAQTTQVVQSNNNNTNLSVLLAQNIFGEPSSAPVVIETDISDAPETKLNLTLTGVVASTNDQDGAAIIARSNRQATYGIGDKIDGTRATLHRVFADRVIISNQGSKETLMLDGVEFTKASQAQVVSPPTRTAPAAPEKAVVNADVVASLRQNPTKFTDFIAINPARQNGQVTGYRVSPGKDAAFFKQVGLQNGDVITKINGLDLTDQRSAMRAMQSLRQANELSLTLLRNGQPQTLTLTLPAQ
jgi:general secretion pathway protein C